MAKFPVNPSEFLGVNTLMGRTDQDGLSILADGARVVGKIVSNGVVKIEGSVEGSVESEKQVLVGRSGVIDGDILTHEATIGGKVRGSVIARAKAAVLEGALLVGNLTAPTLAVEDGAKINGHIRTMTPRSEPVSPQQPPEPVQKAKSSPNPKPTSHSRDRSVV